MVKAKKVKSKIATEMPDITAKIESEIRLAVPSLLCELRSHVETQIAAKMPRVETGIVVAMPNTIERKMDAICDLAAAMKELAKTIATNNVTVKIEGCHIANVRTGIHIK